VLAVLSLQQHPVVIVLALSLWAITASGRRNATVSISSAIAPINKKNEDGDALYDDELNEADIAAQPAHKNKPGGSGKVAQGEQEDFLQDRWAR
jgi:hypothetical protein